MLEMRLTITAADLAAAINNLATALAKGSTSGMTNGATATGTICADAKPTVSAPALPTPPAVNPINAQVASTVVPTAQQYTQMPLVQASQGARSANTSAEKTPAQQPTAPVQAAPAAPAVPTGAPTYTLEMIATAGTALIDAGKMDALLGLLAKYNVEALTALDPSQYGNFAGELRALGAQI